MPASRSATLTGVCVCPRFRAAILLLALASVRVVFASPQVVEPAEEPSPVRLVFLGDSLTAGYGVGELEAFPHLLERALSERGHEVQVVNAGVSGDTTAGGLSRLAWSLRQEPDILVVELGGNDGLRGLPLEMTENNLRQIVSAAEEAGSRILLLGMLMPPNYGPDYTQGFAAIFPRLSEEFGVALVPFLLEGVGGQPELNQPDGIHPTAAGHLILANNVYPYLERMILDLGPPSQR